MNPSTAIRTCQPGDELALSLVGQAAFLEAFADILPAADILAHCQHQHAGEKYRTWLHDPGTTTWIAEAGPGRGPVGYLVLTKPDLPLADLSAEDLEVKRVYVLHRFQGQGVGARLMNEARVRAQERHARRLLLGVYSQNVGAISFYERLGYEKVGTRAFRVGANTYHDFVFALKI